MPLTPENEDLLQLLHQLDPSGQFRAMMKAIEAAARAPTVRGGSLRCRRCRERVGFVIEFDDAVDEADRWLATAR
jgi:hypothetical protein